MEKGLGVDRDDVVERAADLDAEELRRGNADNRERNALERQRLPEGLCGTPESPLPEVITENRYRPGRRRGAHIICRSDQSARVRVHAKDGKELAADEDAVDRFDLSTGRQVQRRRPS